MTRLLVFIGPKFSNRGFLSAISFRVTGGADRTFSILAFGRAVDFSFKPVPS